MSDLIKARKGIFIPDITVEMFRNASLEAVEELLVSGEMQNIILPSAEPLPIKRKCTVCPHCSNCDVNDDGTVNTVEQERLTDDDFETIRIHLNAQKEKLCNQQRWEEAEEYQRIIDRFMAFVSAQPETHNNLATDTISRQAAIDALEKVAELYPWRVPGDRDSYSSYNEAWQDALNRVENEIEALPSTQPTAQPERTCVNCGRTANNGGWYADGRTRCPIEEHYALPKDGYCYLWEKRNVTDDDYPERREE